MKNVYTYLHPTLLKLLGVKGITQGKWICFTGDSGSFKTITCIQSAWRWLTQNLDKNYAVLFIVTESKKETIIRQAKSLGFDFSQFMLSGKYDGRLFFGDEFYDNKSGYMSIPKWIEGRAKGIKQRLGNESRILLIIDSVTSFWEGKAAMSRSIFTPIKQNADLYVDASIVTLQLASGTNKGYGGGVEYAVDIIVKVGGFIHNGYKKKWICVDKARDYDCDHSIHYYEWDKDKNELKVGDKLPIRGYSSDPISAIESMRYYNNKLIEEEDGVRENYDQRMLETANETKAIMTRIMQYLKAINEKLSPNTNDTAPNT